MASRLDKIRERWAAATPGPWEDDGEEIARVWAPGQPEYEGVASAACDPCGWSGCSGARLVMTDADRAFVAHSWADIAALLRVVEAAIELAAKHGECPWCEWDWTTGAVGKPHDPRCPLAPLLTTQEEDDLRVVVCPRCQALHTHGAGEARPRVCRRCDGLLDALTTQEEDDGG